MQQARRSRPFVVAVLTVLALGTPARAGDDYSWASFDYNYASNLQKDFINDWQYDLVSPVRNLLTRPAAGAQPAARPATPTLTRASGLSPVPARLARAYPAAQQATLQRAFAQLLNTYPEVERAFGFRAGDLAGALAFFVAINVETVQGREVPPTAARPLYEQMQRALGGNSLSAVTAGQKRDLYDTLAILSMMVVAMTQAIQQQPTAPQAVQVKAAMRQAARNTLEAFFQTPAEKVTVTNAGLQLR